MTSEIIAATCRNRCRWLLVFAWLSVTCAITAHAQANSEWGLEQLMTQLSQFHQGKAHFVERKYMKVLQSPLELTGTLTYQAHGQMIKKTLQPKPETMTVDDDRITIEHRGKERTMRLQDYPQVWAFVASIRSTLDGDLATLQQFYDLKLTGDRHHWDLILTPKDSKMRATIDFIQIGGNDGHVDTVEVHEAKGDRSEMTIVEDPS